MYQRNMNNFTDLQLTTQSNASSQQMNEIKFFHYTPDNNFYHVTCQIITRSSISDHHDYDHGFFYYDSTINYYVKCKLFSHSSIIKILNKEIYGMDIDMINFERKISLSLDQKLILERNLKQFLHSYFIQYQLPYHWRNTEQMISMNDYQGNKNGFHQNEAVNYIYNVTQPRQQIDFNNISSKREISPCFNRNKGLFHRNIESSSIVAPMIDDQIHINDNGGYNHNIIHQQQQVGFNNISPSDRELRPVYNNKYTDNLMIDNQQADLNTRQVPERETISDYKRDANSVHNDAYDASITDINFDHRDDLNALTQKQVNSYTHSITTQDVPITDVNQNYYDNSMSHNITMM
ncbi:hypothetical protein RclHR1_11450002 [Rhizophagus clarus]|uniref:Uncharacterized protein n=1 Tax=Rhizophagus clarus TaxID=94130 RepID=A0A2Z6QGI2_9GLOM|nr:hypothetical protein RclHR1_11450002 [Rhizophagus clarus]GES75943.1 hypothetical protein GLOIN_2v1810870 [Rhizophagus clarus]